MKDQISICVCTFQRPEPLKRLLGSLAAQETDGRFDFRIIVVDNDPIGSARETILHRKNESGLQIEYDIEPVRTIPAARNRTLRLARGNYVGFIDDDEFAPPDWLIRLYQAIQYFGVDGAMGPVLPFFDFEPPVWLLKGGFCERPILRTGTLLKWHQMRTGNVLVRKDVFDRNHLFFDLEWTTSGSDQALFKKAIEAGSRFVAVAEAPVFETVPPDRWKKRYYLKRALVHGSNAYRYYRGEKHALSRLLRSLKSAAAILLYAVGLPFFAILGTHRLMRALEGGAYHLSWIFSLFGIKLVHRRDF